MDVDKAGRHRAPLGVDGLAGLAWGFTQGNDLAVLDAQIAPVARRARAIDDGPADDLDIVVHGLLSRRLPAAVQAGLPSAEP